MSHHVFHDPLPDVLDRLVKEYLLSYLFYLDPVTYWRETLFFFRRKDLSEMLESLTKDFPQRDGEQERYFLKLVKRGDPRVIPFLMESHVIEKRSLYFETFFTGNETRDDLLSLPEDRSSYIAAILDLILLAGISPLELSCLWDKRIFRYRLERFYLLHLEYRVEHFDEEVKRWDIPPEDIIFLILEDHSRVIENLSSEVNPDPYLEVLRKMYRDYFGRQLKIDVSKGMTICNMYREIRDVLTKRKDLSNQKDHWDLINEVGEELYL